ncbi:MAG: polyamine aminopropyltransferase [Nitrosomonas sp.]|nr:polyamine aminopropyltransferase [Nitrosomonas sp.]
MAKFLKRIARSEIDVAISEQKGVRSLHLGGDMVQSAMRVDAPNALELVYTQCMMGFLLFRPIPAHILMIGLGGGSLAKFVYHHLPQTKTTVIEINRQVISTAFNYFALPKEDERLEIVHADGAQYIAGHPLSTDILMIDGFDDGCQIASLCSRQLYDQAYQALCKDGVLVVNLLSRDKNLDTYIQRISDSFQGHIVAMLADVRGNLIVFAFRHSPGKVSWKTLKTRAKKLEEIYGLPFSEFVFKLRKYNDCYDKYLEL